ncbi:MAG: SURF1 family protein [Bauldia sp.]|nr:SURF1 family protein [Bauldia sp.]
MPARTGLRSLLAPGIATLAGLAILIGLGTWQLQRLAWKNELIATVDARLAAEPIAAPPPAAWAGLDLDALDYQPVTVTGRFLHDREAHVFIGLTQPRGPLGGPGYFILTPLETADGWTVIVNRGFVPQDRKDPATRAEGQVSGEVNVTGLLRRPELRNPFTPADEPDRNMWFTRDPAAIAAAVVPGAEAAPYTIDAAYDPAQPGGIPQGGESVVSFPNNHLMYALTWYGLGLVLVVVFIAFARGRLRGADGRAA